MTDKLSNLANQLFNFEQVYSQIQQERSGRLYKAINLIIDSLNGYPSNAKKVCNYFAIQENSEIDEDFRICYDNIGALYRDIIIENFDFFSIFDAILPAREFRPEKTLFIKICSILGDKNKMRIILITAFILIAVFALYQWKLSNQNQSQEKEENLISALPSNQLIATAICLAVPASEISGLPIGETIDRNKIVQIIDAASDFLCVEVEEAEELNLEIDRNQAPSPDSQLKFYIRIDIPDGQAIIGGQTKYVIKRDLPPNSQGIIKDLGRLKSVSSIELFNRV